MKKAIPFNVTTDINGNYRGFYLLYIQDGRAYPTMMSQEQIDDLNDYIGKKYDGKQIAVYDEPIGETELVVDCSRVCPRCQSDLVWNRFDEKMHCTFCNYTRDIELDNRDMWDKDRALWHRVDTVEKTQYECSNCGYKADTDTELVCPNCQKRMKRSVEVEQNTWRKDNRWYREEHNTTSEYKSERR